MPPWSKGVFPETTSGARHTQLTLNSLTTLIALYNLYILITALGILSSTWYGTREPSSFVNIGHIFPIIQN